MATSQHYIALLRGINVSGKNKIPMKALEAVCMNLGWESIQTHLQTGNVVFTAASSASALEDDFEKAIEKAFGFSIPVIVREAAEYDQCVLAAPFTDEASSNPSQVLLYLTKQVIEEEAEKTLSSRAVADEVVRVCGNSLWIYFPNGVGSSKLTPSAIDRATHSTATGRNWNTVTKIRELLSQSK